MQDPLHKTIAKLTTDAGNAWAGASQNMSAEATLDAASASTNSGGIRRPFIARGMSDPMGELPVRELTVIRLGFSEEKQH